MMSFVMSEGLAQWVSDVHPDSWHKVLGCETYDMTHLVSMPDLVAVVDDEGLIKGRPVTVLDAGRPLAGDVVIVRDNGRGDIEGLTEEDIDRLWRSVRDLEGRSVLCLATRKPKSLDAVVRSYLEGCL